MGRLANENTRYKIRVHKNNGYKYAAIMFQETNDKGKKYCKYKHYGTLDDDLKFHPSAEFLFLPQAEKDKFIFPEDWDLSQVDYFKNMTNSVNESETPTVDAAVASTNQKQDAVTNDTKESEITEIKQA